MKSLLTLTSIVAVFSLATSIANAGEEPFETLYLESERTPAGARTGGAGAGGIPLLHPQEGSRSKLYDQWFVFRSSGDSGEAENRDEQFQKVIQTFLQEGMTADRQLAGALPTKDFASTRKESRSPPGLCSGGPSFWTPNCKRRGWG